MLPWEAATKEAAAMPTRQTIRAHRYSRYHCQRRRRVHWYKLPEEHGNPRQEYREHVECRVVSLLLACLKGQPRSVQHAHQITVLGNGGDNSSHDDGEGNVAASGQIR